MNDPTKNLQVEVDPKTLDQAPLADLLAYWHEKRGGRAMPSRRDIRPSEIAKHLGWVILFDILPGMSDFRYRLIGSLVTQYFGVDSTGRTVSETWRPHDPNIGNFLIGLLRRVASESVVLHTHMPCPWQPEGGEVFDSLYLPLSDDGRTVNMIMQVFVFDTADVLLAREISKANSGHLLHVSDMRR